MVFLRVLDLVSVYNLKQATTQKQKIRLVEPSLLTYDNELEDFKEKFLDGHQSEHEYLKSTMDTSKGVDDIILANKKFPSFQKSNSKVSVRDSKELS